METKRILVFLVAIFALAFVLFPGTVSAQSTGFATIDSIEVNGIESFGFGGGQTAAVFAGETMPVRVVFHANSNASAEDVRIVARLFGARSLSEVTERFDVLPGGTYSRLLNINLPFDIDPNEALTLEITIDSDNAGLGARAEIDLEIQRSSYEVQILAASNTEEVRAGSTLSLDVVLKNRGRQEAEDNFVTARIPALGISRTVYFGDLSPEDQGGDDVPDKEDATERRIFLDIPSDAPAGVYDVELEAFNTDASTVITKKFVIVGANADAGVFSSAMSRTFALGEEATYTMTLVNSGNVIKVYELVPESSADLQIDLDEAIVAIPAGTARTIAMKVSSEREGSFDFAVNVQSSTGELIQREAFRANVEGEARTSAGNTAVLLTVILAIIFVVLLIVLIVLLTRKPEKSEEFGESYY